MSQSLTPATSADATLVYAPVQEAVGDRLSASSMGNGSVVGSGNGSRGPCPVFAPAETSGSRFRGETAQILALRLRAVALLFSITVLLFLIRDIVLGSWTIVPALAVLLTVCLGVLACLGRCHQPVLGRLRWIELGLFWSVAVFLIWAKYVGLAVAATTGDAVSAMAVVQGTTTYFFALMVIYGMFIPNTWPRAAMVVIPLALVSPLSAMAINMCGPSLPGVHALCEHVATPTVISGNVLTLLIGAGTAVYGTHIVHHLRRDVQRARRFGQYRLKRLIGAGGMGEVYLAEHLLLKRPCAVKLIHPEKAGDPRVLARFEKEVRATAKLSHPNTIEIFDYGHTEDGQFYYVMEYLPGLTLSDLVKRYGPLPAGRVVHLLRQVAGAIREAHDLGLLHRDIKPANIFVAHRGGMHDVAKLLDFGLVRPIRRDDDALAASEFETPSITGSPLYMSPEQGPTNVQPDARSDLYSLGAVAYFLITGAPPFQADGVMRLLAAHRKEPPIPPSRRIEGVPADLEQIVLTLLAKQPDDRFQDAEALITALDRCEDRESWGVAEARQWWERHCASDSSESAVNVASPEDQTIVAGPIGV